MGITISIDDNEDRHNQWIEEEEEKEVIVVARSLCCTDWSYVGILARSYTHASPWRCTGWTSLWELGSRLHRVGTVGSSTAKSGLIYYLANLA